MAGLLASDGELHVLHLAEYIFCDLPKLIGLWRSLTDERAEVESRMAEVCLLEEHSVQQKKIRRCFGWLVRATKN